MTCAEYSGLEVEEKKDGEKGSLEQLPTEKQATLNRIRPSSDIPEESRR